MTGAAVKDVKQSARIAKLVKTHQDYLSNFIRDEIARVAPRRIEIVQNDNVVQTLPSDAKRHKMFETALKAVTCGPTTLIGPAGAGKTTMAEQIAEALGLKFCYTGAISNEYKLMGFINAAGLPVRTPFRECYEFGGLYLFDEIDASVPSAVLSFNNAIANGSCDFPDANIKKHKDFKVMAAANTFWNGNDRVYVGRTQLDGASMDRFIFLEIDYDEDLEASLTDNQDWLENVQLARESVKQLKTRHIISPRATIYGSKLLANGLSLKEVEAMVMFKGLANDEVNKIRTKMKEIAINGMPKKSALKPTATNEIKKPSITNEELYNIIKGDLAAGNIAEALKKAQLQGVIGKLSVE